MFQPRLSFTPTQARGFTLVELLVAIAIIALLAALLIPLVLRSYSSAGRTRTAADLQAIATALQAYHDDHGDYPRVDRAGTGFAVLGRALIGAGPAASSNTPAYDGSRVYGPGHVVLQSNVEYVKLTDVQQAPPGSPPGVHWQVFPYADQHDGPGFRLRSQGRTYGPYIQADRFQIRDAAILIRNQPVLYFPASPTRPDIHSSSGPGYVGTTKHSMYDALDNIGFFRRPGETNDDNALARIRIMLGDWNADGRIETNPDPSSGYPAESALHTGPFILWAVGSREAFGPDVAHLEASAAEAHENMRNAQGAPDVTNFNMQ